jgi:hypothetical protein
LKTRLLFSRINKNVHREYPLKTVLKDYSYLLNTKLKYLENYLTIYFSHPETERKISKIFTPTKTAQNGLNFISKQDELNLPKEDFTPLQGYLEIMNIFKIIFILLKHNYEKYEEKELPSVLINKIMTKFSIENFSKINLINNIFRVAFSQYNYS